MRRLAESGATGHELIHNKLAMVEHYTKLADSGRRKRIAND
jgi:hypothetical protein